MAITAITTRKNWDIAVDWLRTGAPGEIAIADRISPQLTGRPNDSIPISLEEGEWGPSLARLRQQGAINLANQIGEQVAMAVQTGEPSRI